MTPSDTVTATTEAVFETYRARIQRHILGLVRDPADAEDLAQETFLRAHRRLERLEEPAALAAWLFRIATNLCRDHLRRRARVRGHEASPPGAGPEGAAEPEPADGSPGVHELLEQAEMHECGEELLEKLPEAHRSVLLMHDLLGLTSVEIASLTHATPGSVKIRLHRARAQFRAALEEACDFYRNERGALVGIRKAPKR